MEAGAPLFARQDLHLKLCMMASRSCWGMSPCMDATVKLFCCIFSVSQSTFRLVLQKMTAWVMVRVSYRSHSVSNFHSSFSTATKNCLMPCSTGRRLYRDDEGEGEPL